MANGVDEEKFAEIWNWGNGQSTRSAVVYFTNQSGGNLKKVVINSSLINDLKESLFGKRVQARLGSGVENSELFKTLQKEALDFTSGLIKRLDEERVFVSGRPISHVIVDIKESLKLLRENVSEIGEGQEEIDLYRKIEEQCIAEWRRKLGTTLWLEA